MMEGGSNEGNRQRSAEAAKPLLQAIETLTTFTASPDFASIPATISAKVNHSLHCADIVSSTFFHLWIFSHIFGIIYAVTSSS